jgi:hypothetical protein
MKKELTNEEKQAIERKMEGFKIEELEQRTEFTSWTKGKDPELDEEIDDFFEEVDKFLEEN